MYIIDITYQQFEMAPDFLSHLLHPTLTDQAYSKLFEASNTSALCEIWKPLVQSIQEKASPLMAIS